jgi:hypothetical protein
MLKFSGFPLNKITLLSVAVGGFVLFTSEVKAQEENSPRPVEKPLVEENMGNQDITAPVFPLFKSTTKLSNSTGVKKELPVGGISLEKESKKNESPSTLSFNIFLYIVDKFKED